MRLKALRTHTYGNRQLRPGAVYSSQTPAHGRFLILQGFAEKFVPEVEEREEPKKTETLTRQEPETEQAKPAPKKRRGRKAKVKSSDNAQNNQ